MNLREAQSVPASTADSGKQQAANSGKSVYFWLLDEIDVLVRHRGGGDLHLVPLL